MGKLKVRASPSHYNFGAANQNRRSATVHKFRAGPKSMMRYNTQPLRRPRIERAVAPRFNPWTRRISRRVAVSNALAAGLVAGYEAYQLYQEFGKVTLPEPVVIGSTATTQYAEQWRPNPGSPPYWLDAMTYKTQSAWVANNVPLWTAQSAGSKNWYPDRLAGEMEPIPVYPTVLHLRTGYVGPINATNDRIYEIKHWAGWRPAGSTSPASVIQKSHVPVPSSVPMRPAQVQTGIAPYVRGRLDLKGYQVPAMQLRSRPGRWAQTKHDLRRPRRGEAEKKALVLNSGWAKRLGNAYGAYTEVMDFAKALASALPKAKQIEFKYAKGPLQKWGVIARNWKDINVITAVENYTVMQMQDAMIGKTNQATVKAMRKHGYYTSPRGPSLSRVGSYNLGF